MVNNVIIDAYIIHRIERNARMVSRNGVVLNIIANIGAITVGHENPGRTNRFGANDVAADGGIAPAIDLHADIKTSDGIAVAVVFVANRRVTNMVEEYPRACAIC